MSAQIALGDVADEIVRRAQECDADLVVLGRQRDRALFNALFGTTAHRVVWRGDCPALVVNTKPVDAYRRPLAALEREPSSHRLVRLATTVLDPDAGLRVVTAYWTGMDPQRPDAYVEREHARTWLTRFLEQERDAPIRLEAHLCGGISASAILDHALDVSADLLVVGAHERGVLAHALFGRAGNHLLAHAPCDLLVARRVRRSLEAGRHLGTGHVLRAERIRAAI